MDVEAAQDAVSALSALGDGWEAESIEADWRRKEDGSLLHCSVLLSINFIYFFTLKVMVT